MKYRFLLIILVLAFNQTSFAESHPGVTAPKKVLWPFDGFLGKFDRRAAQRGFQVYKEVCASCHALKNLSYRNLEEIGFSKAEVKQIASEYKVKDGPNDLGEMFERDGRPSDRFVSSFPNDEAAKTANNGAMPPDLSLIVKSRHDGANYIYSLLTGYKEAPKEVHMGDGLYYNPYFPGSKIAMPPPLVSDNQVTYTDGTVSSIEQMSKDLVIFLQWAAEPEMEKRKSMGLKVMIYLFILTVIFYIAKERIWSRLK